MVNRALAIAVRRTLTFLGRLRANSAGNVLALVAAALPPILILVGGGVDMSRAYMAQTSLQNACDAGVLAGRRAQAKSGTWGTAEQAKAQKMFAINFQGSAANATGTTFTATNPSTGIISATATTTVPTTIMKIFGTDSFALSTSCSAEFQISNIDVMMVLDTTGSMACRPDGSNCNSDSTSKIEGLKSAIRSFYYTIAASVPSGSSTRVRFGFVPYNGTVNLKNLVSGSTPEIPQSYLARTASYQTRLYRFDQPVYTGTPGTPVTVPTTSTQSSKSNCTTWGNAKASSSGGPAPTATKTTTYSWVSYNSSSRICTRNETTTTTSYTLTAYKLSPTTPYRYTQASLDTSNLKALTAVSIATDVSSNATVPATGYTTGLYDMVALGSLAGSTGVTTASHTWGGCIEERSSVNSLISAGSVPSGAADLDLVTAPTSTASTQWKPYVAPFEFDRNQTATLDTSIDYSPLTAYCPPAAKNFATVDTSTPTSVPGWIETYLATLYAWGGTYHDIGMIWGARLAAANGINAATVTAGNLTSVSRHIIFLTDGEMAPACKSLYSAYGQEYLDNRVMPAQATTGSTCDATLATYHNGRFLAACQKAKDMGYTVWVIGFGQSLTTAMTSCASSGRAYYASDTSSLQTTFRTIASQVADLRLKT